MVPPAVVALTDAVTGMRGLDLELLSSGQLLETMEILETVSRQVGALDIRALRCAHERDVLAEECGRSPRSWLIEEQNLSPAEASRRMRLLHALPSHPLLEAAVDAGDISAEHALTILSCLRHVPAELLDAVEDELAPRVAATKHSERVTQALTGRQSAAVLVDDIDAALRVADAYAAEHLEIQTREPRAVAERVRNAGAIFVGPWSPVSLGDYCAGSNHVLPTAGCARHSSGLSVQTFLRGVQLIEYGEAALRDVAVHVVALANAEDLPAHGEAVSARFEAGA